MSKACYIISKLDNKSYCKTNGQFTRHLRKFNLTYREYYEKYVTGYSPLCKCGKPLSFYQNDTYANSCGDSKCVGDSVRKTKSLWTDEERMLDSKNKLLAASKKTKEQIFEAREKAKQTYFKKFGVEWSNSLDQKEKSKKTKLEKYGIETFNNSKVSAEKNRNKTVEEQNIINDKRRHTNLEKFGVVSPFLLPKSIKNSRVSNSVGREYTMPSGNIIGIRGYENIVLDILLKEYNENELIVHNLKERYKLPTFSYVNANQHTCIYYPDIFIPKENKIIEVKSRWWWDGYGTEKYKNRLNNNIQKYKSVIKSGYRYEVWLFETKENYKILKDEQDFQT